MPSWPLISFAMMSFSYVFAVSLTIFSSLSAGLAEPQAFVRSSDYNDGKFGKYVTQTYRSSNVTAPRLNFMKPFTNCDDGSYLFISPRGNAADSMPYILDAAGNLVWTLPRRYGEVYNFQVEEFNGEPHLLFWAGDDAVGGHGAGRYFMFNKHYEEVANIPAANGLDADLHELRILPDGTALISVYDIHKVDLTGVQDHGPNEFIWDSLFQRIDLRTGEALFQWRASDHIAYDEVFRDIPEGEGVTRDRPWDFYHINTVDIDPYGNYIVSGRFTRSIAYISGQTGEVLWRLGGKKNNFNDLSGGAATFFVGQHHTQWQDNYTTITLFDNRADWFGSADSKSTGTKIRVNVEHMTAELLQVYVHPTDILSISQGSYQTLPNGNVLIGYGFNAVMTEFSPDGQALCDAYMLPSRGFGSGDVQSYRNFKFHWSGHPLTKPSVAVHDGAFYISWLGATEVRKWSLRDAVEEDGEYVEFGMIAKDGFETVYKVDREERLRRWVKVVALDRDSAELAASEALDVCNGIPMLHDDEDAAALAEIAPVPFEEPVQVEYEDEEDVNGEPETQDSVAATVAWVVLGFLAMFVVTVMIVWLPKQRAQARAAEQDEEKHGFLAPEDEEHFGLTEEADDDGEEEMEAVANASGLEKPPELVAR